MLPFIPDREISIIDAIDEYLAYSKSIGALSESSVYIHDIMSFMAPAIFIKPV